MPPPPAPAPDYSAAWAAYYQQQAAAAAGAQAHAGPGAPSPYPQAGGAAPQNMGAYGYRSQQPYGAVAYPVPAGHSPYPGLQPMGMQARPPVYPQQPGSFAPTVGPQAYPSPARPMSQAQPMAAYSAYQPGGGGGASSSYAGARPPLPMRGGGGGIGPQAPMSGVHPSPNQSFPPAKRPRFDSGPGGGAGPASFTRTTPSTIPVPASANLPSNPMTIATPMAGPSSNAEYFAGGDGRDGMSMSGPGSRGGRGGSVRGGGKGVRGGYGGGYDDEHGSVGSSFRGKGRGGRLSPPPNGPTGPRNSGPTAPRNDRGGFKGRGRGAFAGSHHRDLPDAPRGPASTRAGRQAKESTQGTPVPSDKARPAKEQREEKKTLTDFKIVGLEVPELDWRWGVVHGQDREEEVEGSGGRKRKAEVGNEDGGPSSPSATTSGPPSQKQQRGSYFMTHGKENTSKAEQVTRDVNRLRIYFDSPAGQGHGEKRGRGGIEGLRAPPLPPAAAAAASTTTVPASPAPPTGPRAMATPTPAKKESVEVKEETIESEEAAKPTTEKEDVSIEDAPSTAATPNVEEPGPSPIVEEPASDVDAVPTSTDDHLASEANDDVKVSSSFDADDEDARRLAPSSPQDAILDNSEDVVAVEEDANGEIEGDVSMLSPRQSVEPEAGQEEAPKEVAVGETNGSIEDEVRSEPVPDLSSASTRELSVAPTASAQVTPAPEAQDVVDLYYRGPEPSDDRISILYERSTRRLCIDADVVERVRISRTEGKVELTIRWNRGVESAMDRLKLAEPTDALATTVDPAEGKDIKPDEVVNAPVNSSDVPAGDSDTPVETVKKEEEPSNGEALDVLVEGTDAPAADQKDATPLLETTLSSDAATPTVPPTSSTTSGAEKPDNRRWDICRGVLMELLDEETETFKPVNFEILDDMWDGVEDPCAGWTPPIHRLITVDSDPAATYPMLKCETFKIIAYLDQERPLSEPKWVRTGNVEDWLNELFGRMKVDNKKVSNWRGKFEILDPEPAPQTPTIQNTLDSWATNSTAGSAKERRRFVKTHLSEMDNIFEILLRLTRGERTANSAPIVAPANLAGPLATASSPNSPFANKQNHVSLAVLAMLRLTYELAEKAGVPSTEVNDRVSEIIRSIPNHLLFKSVDGIFRDHLADKKH